MSETLVSSLVVSVIMNFVSGLFFFKDKPLKESLLPTENSKDYIRKIYIAVGVVINFVIAILLANTCEEQGTIFIAKRIVLISLLWPIALIDLKTLRIPNKFILIGLISRVVILGLEFLFKTEALKITLIGELFAAVGLFVASVLCSVCIKNSVGYGDMKLFVVMGLLLGIDGIWDAVFTSLIVLFIVSVFLLLTKKKSKKDAIPFGPAIALGTYISIALIGM